MRWTLLTDWLAYVAVRVFICLIQSVRIETCHTVSRGLAFVAHDLIHLRGEVVSDNLRHAFPHLTDAQRRGIARDMWEHLFLMVCEIAHAPRKIHRRNWQDHVTMFGRREFVRYLLDPRPTVLVTGHFGNFEMGGFITGLLGFPSYTVARTLDNPYLNRYINSFRGANGQFILPKQGSAAQVQAVLASGGLLALLGDQNAGAKGCWVEFLGRPAPSHKAIALFPISSGAPMLAAATTRRDRPLQFSVRLLGVIDPGEARRELGGVTVLTQWYNDRLAEAIREHPEQYWWVHRRWKGTPPKRFATRAEAA